MPSRSSLGDAFGDSDAARFTDGVPTFAVSRCVFGRETSWLLLELSWRAFKNSAGVRPGVGFKIVGGSLWGVVARFVCLAAVGAV